MATVKVIQVRANLRAAIRYGVKGAKTGMGEYVSSGVGAFSQERIVDMAVDRFEYSQEAAELHAQNMGTRRRGRRPSVLAHHIIQSFKPGETNASEAHQIGVEFIKKIAGGHEHDWVVATHIDKHHIHNHIYLNPVNNKTLERMKVRPWTLKNWRGISDELCRGRGLSVIDTKPQRYPRRRQIHEIYASLGGGSEKKWLAGIIDEAVVRAHNWGEFATLLREHNIGVSMRGANVVFSLPREGSRGVRGASLGAPYTQAALINRINGQVTPTFIAADRLVGEKDAHGVRRVFIPRGRDVFGRAVYMSVHDAQLIPRGNNFIGIAPENTMIDLCDAQGRYVATIPSSEVFKFFAHRQPHLGISRPAIRPRGKTEAQQRYFAKVDRQAETIKVKHSAEASEIRRRWAGMSGSRRAVYAREIVSRLDTESAKLDELIVKREKLSQEIEGSRFGAPTKRIELGRIDEAIARQELVVRSIHAGWQDTVGTDPQFTYINNRETTPVIVVPLQTVTMSEPAQATTHNNLGTDRLTYKSAQRAINELRTGEIPPAHKRAQAKSTQTLTREKAKVQEQERIRRIRRDGGKTLEEEQRKGHRL